MGRTRTQQQTVYIGVGAALMLIVLLVLQSQIGSGLFSTKTDTSTVTTTVTLPPALSPVVYEWLYDLDSRDITAIVNLYSQNSTVTWIGNAAGLTGIYSGEANVEILYGATVGKYTAVSAKIANYSQKFISPSDTNATFSLSMTGNSSVLGAFSIEANVTQDWSYLVGAGGGGEQQWQIVKEDWNFTTFNQQFPPSDTTFPQWSVMKSGGNPNLVSEKSFEWHAGPYIASSVYAFLFGVAAFSALRLRAKSRRRV